MTLNDTLALVDAGLGSVAAVCMLAGWRAIKRRAIERHRNFMLGAGAASALFLGIFMLRFVRFGFRRFGGQGALRAVYTAVFLSHEPLAVVNVPLVLAAAILALTGRYRAHREVALWAFPIWLYVALSGVTLHLLLSAWPG
jgi:putative membrane protein